MAEFQYEVKIPKERIAVLIGADGITKKSIEDETHTAISIDSKEGDVTVKGEDALSLYTTRELVKAIGRGFNPDVAMLLLKQDYSFELIDITEFVKSDHLNRVRGRVIGSEGKARKNIERLTDCHLCVFGKTVGIIGRSENTIVAKRAVESLLNGSPHSSVYKWLERQRRDQVRQDLLGEEEFKE